jgi:hypothetical protein
MLQYGEKADNLKKRCFYIVSNCFQKNVYSVFSVLIHSSSRKAECNYSQH